MVTAELRVTFLRELRAFVVSVSHRYSLFPTDSTKHPRVEHQRLLVLQLIREHRGGWDEPFEVSYLMDDLFVIDLGETLIGGEINSFAFRELPIEIECLDKTLSSIVLSDLSEAFS